MPQVSVTAVAVACIERKIDAVFVTVFNLIFPGLHGPYVGHSPRSDDLQIRSKGFDAKLETDLVVAFSGCAVAEWRKRLLFLQSLPVSLRIAGRAMEVPRRYLCSYTAPASTQGMM